MNQTIYTIIRTWPSHDNDADHTEIVGYVLTEDEAKAQCIAYQQSLHPINRIKYVYEAVEPLKLK